MNHRIWTTVALFAVIAATIGCDRATKFVADTTLAGSTAQSYLADTVRLEWTQNAGAFLGLGSDWPPVFRTGVFTVGNALILGVLILAAVRRQWSRPTLFGLALFIGGGASNLADRLARGTVTDFINVGLGPVRTGIFNIADVAILLGAGLVVLARYRSRERAPEVAAPIDPGGQPS